MALADREFINDGSALWSPDWALTVLKAKDAIGEVEGSLVRLREATEPVPGEWLADRLTVLWTMYMASRQQADSAATTIWLAEYGRLLADLPHDIVANAIDKSIQRARHGFIPSIGEIRAFADTEAADRRRAIERLSLIAETLKSQKESHA